MKRNRLVLAPVALALAFVAGPAGGQQARDEIAALKSEIETLKRGQAAIMKDLQDIKAFLQRAVAGRRPARSVIETVDLAMSIGDDPAKGAADARLTLVEFSDYQCPFCRRHSLATLPSIDRDYIQTGKLRYVMRDFPIESIHPFAFKAAEAANCAGEHGKYWAMHDRLFGNPRALGPQHLTAHAAAIALDATEFRACLESGRHAAEIRADMAEGVKSGVTATPTFFLGVADGRPGMVRVVRKIRGARPYAVFKQAIDGLLAEHSRKGKADADR